MSTVSTNIGQNALSGNDLQLREWLLKQAEDHGNAVVQVEADGQGAPYCFTVGAWRRFGVAEAVVIGLPVEMGTVLLNAYVAKAKAGLRFRPGELYDDFFQGVHVTLERVSKAYYPEFFGSAFLLYPNGDFPAVQLLVPGGNGSFPWQDNSPAGFAAWQPVLTESGRPESWIPGVDGP